jgi:TonB family protein
VKRAFAVSSAAHIAFLILMMVPGFHRTQIPLAQVINVKLVGEEKPEVKKAPKVETPAPRVEVEKEPEKPKMTYKPKTKTRKTEAPKTETNPPKTEEKPKEEPKKAEDKPRVSGTQAATGAKSSVRVDDENFKFAYYLEIVRETISYNWSPPPVSASQEGVMTTVYFKIARDGRVSGVKVEEKSSFDLFDRSATRAVNISSPLPPLPSGFSGRWLGVHFEFEQTSG